MSNLSQFGCCNNIPSSTILIEFLLVGGGGGSGNISYVAPGGAGGMVEGFNFAVTKGDTYPITVGFGGGIGSAAGAGGAGNPGNSSAFANIIAGGGGGGSGGIEPGKPGIFNGSGGGNDGALSPTSGGSQYTTVTNYFGKIQVIRSFATSGGLYFGGTASGTPDGKFNDITGTSLPYCGINNPTREGRGHGGSSGAGSGSGVGGRFVVRWPTAYPDATSVSGNTPVPGTAGYYTYSWNIPGSITF